MIVISKYLVPKGYLGITIFPFVILKHKRFKNRSVLLNHEKIHLKQQLELFIIPFYVWYILAYVVRFIQYKNHDAAYRNISFEREAYAQEFNLDYLQKRSCFQFLKYICKHGI
ncbi:hypothetical protein ACFFU9_05245 [Mariniflexile ostreae]|uniref:Beta-lactamase regulating signal transducer with metallopeptidase domain n=1 Tax=Mariniflexile ostreae TaxID=1520892 RepID=A0ABV5F9T6_9FLAO